MFGESYLKSVKITEGLSRDEAKRQLGNAGYTFLDRNLNEGAGQDEVYLGYTTSTSNLFRRSENKKNTTLGGVFHLISFSSIFF